MKPTNITIKVLEEIRDSVRELESSLGGRIDETNSSLKSLENRVENLDNRVEHLENRVVEGEIRLGTAVTNLIGAVLQHGETLEAVKNLLCDNLGLRPRVERCETEIDRLKGHTGLK